MYFNECSETIWLILASVAGYGWVLYAAAQQA